MQNSIIEKAKQIVPDILDKAKQMNAKASRIVFYQRENIDCSFEKGRLKSTGTKQNLYYRVEVIVNGKKGVTFGNNLNNLETITGKAIELAKIGSIAHFSNYPEPAPLKKVKTYSEKTASLSRESIIETCEQYSNKLKAYNRELFIMADAGRSEWEKLITTSSGICETINETNWHLSCFVQQTNKTDILFAGYARIWRDLNEYYNADILINRTIEQLEYSKNITEPKKGNTIAFLTPYMLNLILYGFTLGINGRNVAKGDSPLKGRLGENIFSKSLTITDNPLIDFSRDACPISNEGVPTKITPLVENGILKSFLYDLDSAGLDNAEPTGHNACTPYNLCVKPGEKTGEQLILEIDDGIYINDLMGFGQSNIMNGDFSCNLGLGFRIKNGKIVGRIKNVMVSGNIYELFKNNLVLSSDTEPTIHMPYAVIEGLNVS